jgi:hypothetical protein
VRLPVAMRLYHIRVREDKCFDFAKGVYRTTVDKFLEIEMSKQCKADGTGTTIEHPNWKILLRTEVHTIIWETAVFLEIYNSNQGFFGATGESTTAVGSHVDVEQSVEEGWKKQHSAKEASGTGREFSPATVLRMPEWCK